ncbi:hypothetical protein SDC9_44066 [bioreactor metagenome]|uniref:Lipoprotein n=1 Tax=bioreactor metagenome TaxID=1076179 RepID=A0A644W349_9ZZZZ
MKIIFYLSCLFLLYGCVFSYDPARGLLHVRNNSSEAVYVYLNYGNADSLPLVSGLELFAFINANKEDAYAIGGSRKKPSFPSNENEVTLFFITEKTMRSYDLEEIHKNQMFVKKITLTKEELENEKWIVTYP